MATAVEELLVDAQGACAASRGDGRAALGDIHEAARQVTSALDGLLDHVKTSPKITTREHLEETEYEKILRSSNRIITGPPQDLVRQSEHAIRHSRILLEQIEQEAEERPEKKERLMEAARRVATATSQMIDATKECESRPGAAESQMALRSAAERLAATTSDATSEQQTARTMERLEDTARQTAYNATQTIAAASACKVSHSLQGSRCRS